VPSNDDAADDAAIWINPTDRGSSLIIATDKRSGLLVYGLDGRQRQYLPLGNTNNVDLRSGAWGEESLTLVAASGRYPSELLLLTVDHATGELLLRARHRVSLREPYGVCLYLDESQNPYVFLTSIEGTLAQYSVDPQYQIKEVRRARIRSRAEGCVADDDEGLLYVAEERRGIWRLPADPDEAPDPYLLDAVGGGHLVADVEGLAIYHGEEKLLIASSQGSNSFAVYDLATSAHVLSFRITGSDRVDGASDSDGVAATTVELPDFPHGLLVVQDGYNTRPRENQNFKIVSFDEIEMLLENHR
jgi:3-phytase